MSEETLTRAQVRTTVSAEILVWQTIPMLRTPVQLGPQNIFVPRNLMLKKKSIEGNWDSMEKQRLLYFLRLIVLCLF